MRRYLPIALVILVALIVISRISTADSAQHSAGGGRADARTPATHRVSWLATKLTSVGCPLRPPIGDDRFTFRRSR